jgi:hypothetical protein
LYDFPSSKDWRAIKACAKELEFPPGSKVLKGGDRYQYLDIIIAGSCTLNISGVQCGVYQYQCYGELCFVLGGESPYQIVSQGMTVMRLDPSSVKTLFAQKPEVGRRFFRFLSATLLELSKKLVALAS